MTLSDVIDTLQTWIRNADDEYDREEMGRVAGLKEALHEIKRIEPCEDSISRADVIKIIKEHPSIVGNRSTIVQKIVDLPSVTPKTLKQPNIPPMPKKKAAVNRQVIVTWFTPEEKLPEEDIGVLATVTAKGGNKEFIRTIITAYYCKDEGWYELDYGFSEMKVHAWCDLEPYGGN